jgi:hypothetical protein
MVARNHRHLVFFGSSSKGGEKALVHEKDKNKKEADRDRIKGPVPFERRRSAVPNPGARQPEDGGEVALLDGDNPFIAFIPIR